jgi:thymidine kinase
MTPTDPASSEDVEEGAEPCAIPDCGAPSSRNLTLTEAKKAFPQLGDKGRRAPLCRAHYKEWKKSTKEARKLDRLAW